MFCSSCGSSLVPGAMHCGNCGAAVAVGTGAVGQAAESYNQQPSFGQSSSQHDPFQNPYGQNMQYQVPTTSGKAIASLVLSVLGISLIAVILGHLARGEIKRSQGRVQGDGLAIAGLVIGWIGVAGWVLVWILVFAAASMSNSYYY